MSERSEIDTRSEEQTVALGLSIGRILKPGDVILLEGALGSGKTRLAKGIVSGSTGISPDEVVSPTFTLINTYQGDFPVHHADLYRLDIDQVDDIGLEDTIAEGGALVVEWGERIRGFDRDPLVISIDSQDAEEARRIVLEWRSGGSWSARIGKIMGETRERAQ
jgi:tRNA threonylcarbamoyladenosine biosynthesis protein TsaE